MIHEPASPGWNFILSHKQINAMCNGPYLHKLTATPLVLFLLTISASHVISSLYYDTCTGNNYRYINRITSHRCIIRAIRIFGNDMKTFHLATVLIGVAIEFVFLFLESQLPKRNNELSQSDRRMGFIVLLL